eukprot:TRINITY_DN66791_c7_g7_i1.p1 TRINITY_DN66791_c7_g7~~TRINITY_DN66791_c7_g7_i1.p1  ORF type:complete len:255 (-),score=6.83 TRINITY_DN66791_c7_g7_i1:47-811(-)
MSRVTFQTTHQTHTPNQQTSVSILLRSSMSNEVEMASKFQMPNVHDSIAVIGADLTVLFTHAHSNQAFYVSSSCFRERPSNETLPVALPTSLFVRCNDVVFEAPLILQTGPPNKSPVWKGTFGDAHLVLRLDATFSPTDTETTADQWLRLLPKRSMASLRTFVLCAGRNDNLTVLDLLLETMRFFVQPERCCAHSRRHPHKLPPGTWKWKQIWLEQGKVTDKVLALSSDDGDTEEHSGYTVKKPARKPRPPGQP